MVRPDYKEFSRLAQESTLIPLTKSVTADLQTPVSAFLAIAGQERRAFLLESVEGGEKIGRYTFLGARPYMAVTARGREITVERGKERKRLTGSIFEVLRDLLGQHRPAPVEGLPPFTSGAVGFFAYDVVRQLEKLPSTARLDTHTPDCVMMFFDRLLAFDHLRHQIHLIAAADLTRESPRAAYDRAVRD
ncbi:MAG: anthranilate synthase component I, partial [Terriglobales bacterium]